MSGWYSHVQAASFGVGTLLARVDFSTTWRVLITSASRLSVVFLGSPAGAAAQLLDGTLKLRCCTTIQPWVLPRFGDGVGKRYAVTSDFLMACRSNFGKRVWLTRNTRASIPVHDASRSRASNAEAMEKIPISWLFWVRVSGCEPGNLFSRLGLR